ncbi:CMP-N-acetylneuraminate-beta-galactosamide-alpha-2,3-sialyltransferase 2 [Bombina bombina]|uniref:CMP-N-acetylneuraminate-beta-galactosamide- alpha-2,3-sialyltransferase 2 n=1 Tax=Bombina bombina TaxID=8345 RepID=UPI00235A4930|nr:CMP-N-acetylneuraminate-beta-galactosamide-alpha-2,3-sialyltransferase 2 [Bombina bombina]XP_053551152.1 CMP-N-acetylneuraminate-beta-galactosamide-alpha-2,3-sialyltransferase 2 [Bombina bombina]XP_053551217.1 CMP-N-acetylneuraminate-beta-galactosamide-alpha-2,3-sialyltransferase 2 [Bombina bombina]
MQCMHLCCCFLRHKRIVWITPVLSVVVFLIYFTFIMEYSSPVEHVAALNNAVCMCGRCRPEKRRTEWFNTCFNDTIDPVLVAKHQKIPDDVKKWWLKLQGRNNASHFPEVLEQMFKVVPTGNPYEEQENRPCRICAVVGNSGNLKGSQYGTTIDSHGFIFRMNGARTEGFEADVGSRTTHHFMYPESAIHLSHGVHLVLIPFKLQDLRWITSALTTGEIKFTYTKVKPFINADKDKVLIFSPTFFKYIHDNWTKHNGKYPSTGMLALFFALHICDEISVFGFGADNHGNWHHYWENNRFAGAFRKTGVHNADFESKLLTKLANEGRVKLFK